MEKCVICKKETYNLTDTDAAICYERVCTLCEDEDD